MEESPYPLIVFLYNTASVKSLVIININELSYQISRVNETSSKKKAGMMNIVLNYYLVENYSKCARALVIGID
ncbi:hypothetical protein SVI_2246 [Shewanella violacea DSS12]|uniref:Uncharacterized protein n=1 Tax=Shewanella violacea (strain JCM 10179 / CIP 106290 / LMG 19151 / DSS12) TaxID=637905 RepID=D4ZKL8_SHEVD|nr:hypothetical protein SVI_2246 [Shewanella violacea DSS12]